MGMEFTESAAKHGMSEQEILHVIRHAVRAEAITDRHGDPAKMITGPVHAQTNRLAEVAVKTTGGDFIVFHAMETGERA